ncbi:DUF2510 domain-containing protein [Kitasatospora sp. NPDC051914]|uniref:DUF2510 domain-containing protein n=1 Tax=Kitasatospora sp. NPDC051914 TaxID=3154945 RepID=UPI003447C929
MSTSTPPGWYPVPETGPGGAAQERWWDGTAWTAEVRPAQSAAAAQPAQIADAPTQAWSGQPVAPAQGYGYPQQQSAPYGYPQPGPPYAYPSAVPGPKNRNGLIIGIAAGVLALAVIAGVVLVLADGDDDPPVVVAPPPSAAFSASPRTSPSLPRTSPSPRSSSSALAGSTLTDIIHGWRVPRPTGWTVHSSNGSQSVWEVTGPYDCGMETQCIRGQFSVETVSVPGTDAATVAKAAMAEYAPRIFGDLASHEELTSGSITVAGATGYAVRWHVTPKQGASGYVLMVAVPDARGRGFVMMHGGVDDDPKAPDPGTLDAIVKGIRSTTAGSNA